MPARTRAIPEALGVNHWLVIVVIVAIGAIADECAFAGDTAPKLLIGGSLYLAGEILRLNAQLPD